MANCELQYISLEHRFCQLSVPVIPPPEVENEDVLDQLEEESIEIQESYFPLMRDLFIAVEFVARDRYVNQSVYEIDQVLSLLLDEVEARKAYPEAAYFRSTGSMFLLREISDRILQRTAQLARSLSTHEMEEDLVLRNLMYAFNFYSYLINPESAYIALRNARTEKEAYPNLDWDKSGPNSWFVPLSEFPDFEELYSGEIALTNQELMELFKRAAKDAGKASRVRPSKSKGKSIQAEENAPPGSGFSSGGISMQPRRPASHNANEKRFPDDVDED